MRLLTWNTWKNSPPYRDRLAALAQAAAEVRPDIVLLQEAFVGGGEDTAAFLASSLDLQCLAAPARPKPRKHDGTMVDSTNGLAILSRQEPSEHRVIALPPHPDDPDRIAQIARFEGFTVVNLHLTHLVDGDVLRRDQIHHLLEQLDPKAPTILGGDLNAEPGDPALAALLTAGFRDLAADRPQDTVPGRRIDFLMIRALPMTSATTGLIGAAPVKGVAGSDHMGVFASLIMA
ncbi:endonuclease/exonuclease/phosphatase family protein [Thalassobaculum sp. OXR-137]|uniref:endonuclease/exonuclease/phosphatase family protein n=1 Tax=Thalassobaculum sp. OXR-137 TaxID=3100173 RepID=UPI002AC996A2|nr:endonuclease/exonuclease/phosphatase family protein [Thalassobaculum sp. OXR-137]WPZ35614.1 endonuclease/exonuclease/phosphatase family protein [Thalassobaculum sp. OXR-137]